MKPTNVFLPSLRVFWASNVIGMVFVLWCLLVAVRVGRSNTVINASELQAIAAGEIANRSSFQSVKCEFTVVNGNAPSVAAALGGQITVESSRNGRWLVDGSSVYYHLLCDSKAIEATKSTIDKQRNAIIAKPSDNSSGIIEIPCSDLHMLRNSSYTLRYVPLMSSINLYKNSDAPPGILESPFGCESEVSLGTQIQIAVENNKLVKFDGLANYQGKQVLSVSFGSPSEQKSFAVLQFDPARGYLPVFQRHMIPSTGSCIYESHITAVQECSNGIWFPTRYLKIHDPHASPPLSVVEIVVTSLDTAMPPPQALFEVKSVKGTQVSTPREPYWMNLASDETYRLDSLDQLYQRCVTQHGVHKAQVAEAREFIESSSIHNLQHTEIAMWQYFVVCVNVLIVVLICVVVYRRKRRAKMAGQS